MNLFLLNFLRLIWKPFAIIAGAASFVFLIFNSGKKSEKIKSAEQRAELKEEIAKQEVAETKQSAEVRMQNVQAANDAVAVVVRLDTGAAASKLRDKWSRD